MSTAEGVDAGRPGGFAPGVFKALGSWRSGLPKRRGAPRLELQSAPRARAPRGRGRVLAAPAFSASASTPNNPATTCGSMAPAAYRRAASGCVRARAAATSSSSASSASAHDFGSYTSSASTRSSALRTEASAGSRDAVAIGSSHEPPPVSRLNEASRRARVTPSRPRVRFVGGEPKRLRRGRRRRGGRGQRRLRADAASRDPRRRPPRRRRRRRARNPYSAGLLRAPAGAVACFSCCAPFLSSAALSPRAAGACARRRRRRGGGRAAAAPRRRSVAGSPASALTSAGLSAALCRRRGDRRRRAPVRAAGQNVPGARNAQPLCSGSSAASARF